MNLYEEYKNGLNLVVYIKKAYDNLKKAVYLTTMEDGIYDEQDIQVLWDYIINVGNIECITEKNGARDLVRMSFNMFGDFIDSRLLAIIRDFEQLSMVDFLNLYFKEKEINREGNRIINNCTSLDLGFIDCASTTGPRRENNEDFVCATKSYVNGNYKLLLVCDGIGGFNKGDDASKLVASKLIKWFKAYDFSLGFDNIEIEINQVIDKTREDLKESCVMTGTTLTFAIVLENETLIGNIGDSRTYIIKDGDLIQITKDDSEVWKSYENGDFEKDDLRFLPNNNVLTDAIDDYILRPIHLQTYNISNSSYDGILLVSDGVTDVLSDKSIMRIVNEEKEEDILDKLLYESCYGNPDYPSQDYDEILYPTLPGKDNASGAIYVKKKIKLDKGKKIV